MGQVMFFVAPFASLVLGALTLVAAWWTFRGVIR